MKKFFILFILCFLFVGCAFDTNDSSNLTTEYWYNDSQVPLKCTKCFCKKISTLEYDVISIEEYHFYNGISFSTALTRVEKGVYDNIEPSTITVSSRTKNTVLNNKKVFHYSGRTPLKIYKIY